MKKKGLVENRESDGIVFSDDFFKPNNVSAVKPGTIKYEERVPQILEKYNEELENKKLLMKAKELLH